MAVHRARELLIALAAAAVVAGAVGGLALLLADSDDAPPPASPPPIAAPEAAEPLPPTEPPPGVVPSSTAPAEIEVDGGDIDFEPEEGTPLPPMGIVSAAFDWDAATLPLATEGWLHQLLEVDGELWAVLSAPEGEGQHTLLYTSRDGLSWAQHDLPESLGGDGPTRFWATDDGVVAIVARWDELGERTELWVAPDGGPWQQADLSGIAPERNHTWLSGVAAGDGVLVAVGATQPLHTDFQPPVTVIEADGLVLEIDEVAASYLITDAATGVVVSHGNLDRIWQQHGEEGLVIHDPATWEPIFRARWEALDEAAVSAHEDAVFGQPLTVELTSGDLMLRLDVFTGRLTVTDPSGNDVFTGTEADLWRGPPPTFTDPRTGEVILVVPWDAWEEALGASYEATELDNPAPLLVRSTDLGATWTVVDAAPDAGDGSFFFNDLVRGPDGFLALGALEPEPGGDPAPPQPVVLHSADGLAWAELPLEGPAGWTYGIARAGDGYLALHSDEDGSAVVASPDGRTWQVPLRDDDLALPLGSAWFEHVAHGPLGTFVGGMWDGWGEPDVEPTHITKGGRTLTIEGPRFTVTDDATGDVLFTFDESDARGHEDETWIEESGMRWGQGGLAMFADDGTVVFALAHPELERAMQDRWQEPDVTYRSEQFVVWEGGAGWQRVALPDDLGPHAWCAGIAVLEDRVVLAIHVDTFHGEGEVQTELRLLVGTPAPGP